MQRLSYDIGCTAGLHRWKLGQWLHSWTSQNKLWQWLRSWTPQNKLWQRLHSSRTWRWEKFEAHGSPPSAKRPLFKKKWQIDKCMLTFLFILRCSPLIACSIWPADCVLQVTSWLRAPDDQLIACSRWPATFTRSLFKCHWISVDYAS